MDADADFSLEQSEAGQTALLTGDWTATRIGDAGLTAWLVDGFRLTGVGSALLGALLLSVVTLIVNALLTKETR